MSRARVTHRVLALHLALVSTGLSARLLAQTDTATLQPVVVTATRVALPLAAPTVSTTVISGDDLRARGIVSVADALRDVPGLSVVQTGSLGGLTSLFLRGGQSNYVKVLLDGTPLNQPGGAVYIENLTTEDVDRIEIVRGPTSVLYGSDAVTGVIQIFTKHGAGAPSAFVEASGGTYGTLDGTADLRGGAGLFAYSLGATHTSSNGILPFNNGYLNNSLTGRVALDAGTGSSLAVTARYHNGDYHFPTEGDGTPVDSNQHEVEEGTSISIDGLHQFSARVDGRILLTGAALNISTLNPPDSPADTESTYLSFDRDETERAGADLRTDLRVIPGGVVTLGGSIEAERDRNSSYDLYNYSGFAGGDSSQIDPHRTSRAAYAEATGNVVRWVSYAVGFRLDDSRYGTFGTYRTSAGLALPTNTRFHAAIGTSFTEPSLLETSSTTPGDLGNPTLIPERSVGWEVGSEQSLWDDRLTVSATYFWQHFQNLIDYTYNVPTDSSPNFFNVAAAQAFGVELGGDAKLGRGFSLSASYTGLTTRVLAGGFDTTAYGTLRVGESLIRRPAHTATGTLAYAVQRGSAVLTLRYVGARDDIDFNSTTEPRVTLPGYTTIDLAGRLRLFSTPRSRFSLTARVANLLDRHYDEIATYQAPGRLILIGGAVDIGSE